MDMSVEVNAAREAAKVAAAEALARYGDGWPCGFAWVEVRMRTNTKAAKALIAAGFEKSSWQSGVLTMWDPSQTRVQNMDVKVAGARAFAKSLAASTGVEVYACSRMD
jgi:hypothetical protein